MLVCKVAIDCSGRKGAKQAKAIGNILGARETSFKV